MKALLATLMFATVIANATPVTGAALAYDTQFALFQPVLPSVAGADIPEWSMLTGGQGLPEIRIGIENGGSEGTLLVLRAALLQDSSAWNSLMEWLKAEKGGATEIIHFPYDPPADLIPTTPEPGTFLLLGAGLALIWRSRGGVTASRGTVRD